MIKILIGGSPCTFWSIAQKNGREVEPEGIGWELFKNYVIAKEKFKPDYFLYENNKSAAQAIKDQICVKLGANLMHINSALVSAQTRQRFYVFNWDVPQPQDRGILLRNVFENTFVNGELNSKIKPLSQKEMNYMVRSTNGKYSDRWTYLQKPGQSDKAVCLTANVHKGVPYNICARPIENRDLNYTINCPVYIVENGKITVEGNQHTIKLQDGKYIISKMTVAECSRLQTMPDNYCKAVSASQAFKCLGNGWTAEVIIHILNGVLKDVPKDEEIIVLSMYDGIGTGRYCLDKMGFTNVKYYAYEIDTFAKKVALDNYPDIIHMGDAFDIRKDDWKLEKSSYNSIDK